VAEPDFTDTEIVELLERLTLHAYTLYGCFPDPRFAPVMPGYGDSPEDLAKEIITKFLDPGDRTVKWPASRGKPARAALLGYLKEAARNDFLDQKKNKRYRTRAEASPIETDDDKGITLDDLAGYLETPEAMAIRSNLQEAMLAAVKDESDLHELLTVLLDPSSYGAPNSNQEIAELLGCTVSDVENRKKKLVRRLLQFRNALKYSRGTN
jgi:DNA-directed RNA polymerase specialized sigma24 family protein